MRTWTLHSMYAPNGLGPFVAYCPWPREDYPQHWLNGEAEHWETVELSAYDALSARLAAVEKERDDCAAALNEIAAWDEGEEWSLKFDEPHAAKTARTVLARLADAARPEQEK